ncbi:MAG: TIGR04086 family membrane protein [Bacillota bacterium]|nr:MAG: TIGR04086 family membrane protein [Bacillota bacterium]
MDVKSDIKMIVSGVLKGLIFSLLAVLIFSFIVKLCSVGDNVIHAVNQFIKSLAVFVGCFFSLKGKLGWLKGLAVGLFVFVFTYLVFALIAGAQVFGAKFFIDTAFGAAVGLISGIISVNVRKDS